MTQLSFNKITIINGENTGHIYSPKEFIQLPVTERVQLVLCKRISFFMNSQEIDKRASLNELREWSSNI